VYLQYHISLQIKRITKKEICSRCTNHLRVVYHLLIYFASTWDFVPTAITTNVILVAIHILAFLRTIWTRYLDVNKFDESSVTHLVLAPSHSYCNSPPRYSNCTCQSVLTLSWPGSGPNSSLSCYILTVTERRSVRPQPMSLQ